MPRNPDRPWADRLRRESEDAIKAYDTALAEARAKAQALAGDATQKAQAESAARSAELDKQLATQTEDADRRIREMAAKAQGDLVSARNTEFLLGPDEDVVKVRRMISTAFVSQHTGGVRHAVKAGALDCPV